MGLIRIIARAVLFIFTTTLHSILALILVLMDFTPQISSVCLAILHATLVQAMVLRNAQAVLILVFMMSRPICVLVTVDSADTVTLRNAKVSLVHLDCH